MSKKDEIINKLFNGVLVYVGLIGAVLMAVVYIGVTVVIITGFKQDQEFANTMLFAGINAIVGFGISQLLKIQGIAFAKGLEDNKPVVSRYYKTKTKDKKMRSIKYFWLVSIAKDVVLKVFTIALATGGIIYIAIEGSKDFMLLVMAFVNLIFFVCLGLLSMNGAYEFFNNMHVPYMLEQLNASEKKAKEEADRLKAIAEQTQLPPPKKETALAVIDAQAGGVIQL